MFSSDNWIRAVFLAYYLTGVNMVLYHSASAPLDRPGYVYLGFWRKAMSGAMWPYVARLNRELGWFVVTYFASVVVAAAFYAAVGLFLDHGFWRTLIVMALTVTPIGAMPLAIVSTLLWLIVSRPLNLRVPAAMERTQARHELGIAQAPSPAQQAPPAKRAGGAAALFSASSHPEEIRTLIATIERFRLAMPEQLQGIADPVLGSLRMTIETRWSEAQLSQYIRLAREGHSPDSFVCNHLVHTMADELESGRHHIYRGVLSGQGNLYRSVFEHAIRTMVARGAYTDEWATENLRKPVYEGIKRVG